MEELNLEENRKYFRKYFLQPCKKDNCVCLIYPDIRSQSGYCDIAHNIQIVSYCANRNCCIFMHFIIWVFMSGSIILESHQGSIEIFCQLKEVLLLWFNINMPLKAQRQWNGASPLLGACHNIWTALLSKYLKVSEILLKGLLLKIHEITFPMPSNIFTHVKPNCLQCTDMLQERWKERKNNTFSIKSHS